MEVDMEEEVASINNLDQVFVSGLVILGSNESGPVAAKRRNEPLQEFILDGLRTDLLSCDGLLAAHYEYVMTAMRERLNHKYREFVVIPD